MIDIERAKGLLTKDIALAIVNGDTTYTSSLPGVGSLLSLQKGHPTLLDGAYVADRVIGKAAAMLMALGKVKEAFAVTISQPAVEVFQKHEIPYSYSCIVDYIKNREGTGLCPMEQAVLNIDMPCLAHQAIIKRLNDMKGKL